jgi:hypothetical protein
MKKIAWIIAVFWLLISGRVCDAVDVNIQTGLNFNWWDSTGGDRGNQTYIPVSIYGGQGNFSAKILTAFVSTNSVTPGVSSDSLSCSTDTKANFSYEIVDRFFADLIFGLDFNLPTGRTKLNLEQQRLVLDPDLVAISKFGEGFNVNPTITLAKVWNKFAAGIGVGYLWRGAYDYSEAAMNYKPGDILNVTGEVSYYFSPKWQGRLFGQVADYGKDQVGGRDYYEEGVFFLGGTGINYFQTDWEARLTVQGIFRGKSQFQDAVEVLTTEDRNSYGDEWSADLSWKYNLSKVTTLRSQLYYLWMVANDYASDSPFYIGDRHKTALSCAIARQFTPVLKGECGLGGYILDVGPNWYHTDDRTYTGLIASVMLTATF